MNDHTTTELPPPGTLPGDRCVPISGTRCRQDRGAVGRRVRKWVLLLIVLVAAVGATGYWYLNQGQATTDDAYTDGHAITVAPQVSGTVVALDVTDNQRVKAGDVLIEIDPRAYVAARDQAQGSLQVAQAQLGNARINLEWARADYPARLAAAQAQLAAAQATHFKADADARRQHGLPKQATTQQEVDNAEAALRSADAQVDAGPGRRCGRPNWCPSTSARPKPR